MKRRSIVALATTLCLAAIPATASMFIHMSPAELVTQADSMIQGRVVDLASFWSESGRLIVTEATIEVEETLIGDAPSTVTVRTFGGEVGDIKVEAPGFPTFEKGERVLLFLKAEPADGSLRVLGYRQGQFRLVTRRDGVTLAVPMVEDDVRLLDRDGRPAPEARSVEVGQFKQRVLALHRDRINR